MVTGFLGSGKTTLLSALLRQPEPGRLAIVINEFGEVPLDQALIGRTEGQVVVLSGGCLCCAIGGDVVSTLLGLHALRAEKPFERVVIETSGLADPGPILAPLVQAPELTGLFRVDGVVAVVDALQGLRELGRQRVCVKQVALADRILLSKSDIAAPLAVTRLRDRLAEINPWAPLTTANHGAVDAAWLFDPGAARPICEHAGHDHDHSHGIGAFCLWFDQPVTWEAFARAVGDLTEAHGEAILRIKGLLNLNGRPVAVHGVQHFLHPPEPLPDWPDQERRSRLIVIADRLTEAEVRSFFSNMDFVAQASRKECADAS
nr:GTP-binding protein [Rhodoblastus sphagnicola]